MITERIRKQWEYLDKVSGVLFNRSYDNLKDKQKTFLHETINGEFGRSSDEIKRFSQARQQLGDLLTSMPAGLRN